MFRMTSGRIKIHGGKILRTASGGIATADACCCAVSPCAVYCNCTATNFWYEATFDSPMDELDGKYYATSKTGDETDCTFTFDTGPVATVRYLVSFGECEPLVTIRYQETVDHTYDVHTTGATWANVGWTVDGGLDVVGFATVGTGCDD